MRRYGHYHTDLRHVHTCCRPGCRDMSGRPIDPGSREYSCPEGIALPGRNDHSCPTGGAAIIFIVALRAMLLSSWHSCSVVGSGDCNPARPDVQSGASWKVTERIWSLVSFSCCEGSGPLLVDLWFFPFFSRSTPPIPVCAKTAQCMTARFEE